MTKNSKVAATLGLWSNHSYERSLQTIPSWHGFYAQDFPCRRTERNFRRVLEGSVVAIAAADYVYHHNSLHLFRDHLLGTSEDSGIVFCADRCRVDSSRLGHRLSAYRQRHRRAHRDFVAPNRDRTCRRVTSNPPMTRHRSRQRQLLRWIAPSWTCSPAVPRASRWCT